jgi:ATP-dependent Clp protease ATP-binding subunit ClpC
VQHEVEDRLSEKILHNELASGDHVVVDFKDGEFQIRSGKRGELVGAASGEITATPAAAAAAE